jgi:purine-nucleoside phosphorylase
MSLHLAARLGEIAPVVLITGDPLRAKHYAEMFLTEPSCYNRIRGMLGYTGTWNGTRVSIQGTGIGIPSTALYLHELIHSYDVSCVIRIGTCGALQADLALGDLVAATHAHTDSAAVSKFLRDSDSPYASDHLLQRAEMVAKNLSLPLRKGPLFSTDLFYSEDNNRYDKSKTLGLLGVDMETSMLYAMASHYGVSALSILTVSDNLITGAESSAEEREKQANDMMSVALRVVEEGLESKDLQST